MELIPAMIEEADRLASIDVSRLSDSQLAEEIKQRLRIHGKWEDVYKDDFIPFAHGARLFGQVYNDKMHPSDPYEFTDLLKGTSMVSVRRNGMLIDMAEMVRKDASLAKSLEQKSYEDLGIEFSTRLEQFLVEFGDFTYIGRHSSRSKDSVSKLLLQMASQEPAKSGFQPRKAKKLAEAFISRFEEREKAFASELLDLARVSYQLRDDDNIYIGRIEGQMHLSVEEGKRRIEERGQIAASQLDPREVARVLIEPDFQPSGRRLPTEISQDQILRSRQIVGQPSGPGIAVGKARVIINASDLFDFKAGEILVCDAIDPNMTFVVPLSAAVVERRGGMLIHGAIIAREYGLPCVTGVPNATSAIRTGDEVTVDGFLGIVIIGKPTIT
jgi:pyruvate,water dikinase